MIKDHGYKWNPETKTLEKTIVPKFKVGDTIRSKNGLQEYNITNVTSEYYSTKVGEHAVVGILPVKDQNDWILIPNKFDPKTLQPFDKVLGKLIGLDVWHNDFYSHYDIDSKYPYMCISRGYKEIVPYNEETKHLLGTTQQAPEKYIIWQ